MRVRPRVFSGIQPTGIPHLGNYLGALRHWKTLQKDHDCHFCLVDLHAVTMPWDPGSLRSSILQSAACLLAIGLDPKRLYVQSSVAAHLQLGWLFTCTARIGWLNRMTQFKDKAGKNRESHSAGLYVYPALMAADILALGATRVPVGEDQRQHIELANDIAAKFNHDLGRPFRERTGRDFFSPIEAVIAPQGARVMNLRDGTKKMSKSDPSEQTRILLNDSADEIAQKIRRAKTDSGVLPQSASELQARPEAQNLVQIYAALADQTLEQTLHAFAGQGFGDFKKSLTDLLISKIEPISLKTRELLKEETHLQACLKEGAENARRTVEPVIRQAYELAGFPPL